MSYKKRLSESRCYKIVFWPCSFFEGQEIISASCVLDFLRSQSQHVAAQASHSLGNVQHVQLSWLLQQRLIVCERWYSYILRHRAPLRVLLTHVQKAGLTDFLLSQFTCLRLGDFLSAADSELLEEFSNELMVNFGRAGQFGSALGTGRNSSFTGSCKEYRYNQQSKTYQLTTSIEIHYIVS